MPFQYPYARPAVTCDVVAFTLQRDDLAVLLVRRKTPPFRGAWALPGGFVDENEALERAALRELAEETGVGGVALEQLGAFGEPGRDPRGHTITVAWMTFLLAEVSLNAGDDAAEARFLPLRSLDLDLAPPRRKQKRRAPVEGPLPAFQPSKPCASAVDGELAPLAFDHAKIIEAAVRRLRHHLDHPLERPAFEFLPARFTLLELKRTYELCLNRSLSIATIRRRLVDRGLVTPVATKAKAQRESPLYRWNRA